jgi:hypothetical protein
VNRGRAELEAFEIFFDEAREPRLRVEQVADADGFLAIALPHTHLTFDRIAPVRASTQIVRQAFQQRRDSVPAGSEMAIERRSPQSAPRRGAPSSSGRLSRDARISALLSDTRL